MIASSPIDYFLVALIAKVAAVTVTVGSILKIAALPSFPYRHNVMTYTAN